MENITLKNDDLYWTYSAGEDRSPVKKNDSVTNIHWNTKTSNLTQAFP